MGNRVTNLRLELMRFIVAFAILLVAHLVIFRFSPATIDAWAQRGYGTVAFFGLIMFLSFTAVDVLFRSPFKTACARGASTAAALTLSLGFCVFVLR